MCHGLKQVHRAFYIFSSSSSGDCNLLSILFSQREEWDAKIASKKRGKKRLGDIVKEADSKRKYSMGK